MLAQDVSSAPARHGARELLIKALYQWQLSGHSEAELREQYAALPEFERIDQAYFSDLLATVFRDEKRLDRKMQEHADRGVENIDAISRAALLLGLAELNEREDVPTKVIINEVVELANPCLRRIQVRLERGFHTGECLHELLRLHSFL